MDNEYIMHELSSFLTEDGRITALPSKHKKKLYVFYYLASKIEAGKTYTESEINDILDEWTLFHDPATLRRELFNKFLLNRTNDCRTYWKEENLPPLEEFIAKYV